MKSAIYDADILLNFLKTHKIATLDELKKCLGTDSYITVFRKLKELDYLSSCSHSGKYYTLRRIAKFDDNGLWYFNSVLFSSYTTLSEAIRVLVGKSFQGYTALEIEQLLNIKPNESLLKLTTARNICRVKISGKYVYFSSDRTIKTQQELRRESSDGAMCFPRLTSSVAIDEVKAAVIIFFSILDEKQRRLYAGLESIKLGYGGDKVISEILGINIKTVQKGRHELLNNEISIKNIRKSGAGRRSTKKKFLIS